MEKEPQLFCRLCLTTSVVYHSLLQNNGSDMLLALTGTKISDDDLYSTDSCVKCWLKLKHAYCIQQCFIEAEKNIQLSGTDAVKSGIIPREIKVPIKEEIIEETENENSEIIDDKNEDVIEKKDLIIEHDSNYVESIYIEIENEVVEEKPSFCWICGMKCVDEVTLYCHLNSHYAEPKVCSECSIKLPNISAYRDHIQSKHPKLFEKRYTCGICSLSFKYMPFYDIHLSAAHPDTARTNKRKRDDYINSVDGKSYQCEECSRVFSLIQAYNKHVKTHARKPCPVCGVNVTVNNFNKHVVSHEVAPVICEICGAVSKNRECLRWHMGHNHSKKVLTCEECGQQFKKLYLYRLHIKKKHTGEKGFTCDSCGKGFFTRFSLNTHIKTAHLKERKYTCKYCDKKFSKKVSLTTHLRIHTNELPYICEICNEGFRQNVSLRTHRKSKHNIIEHMTTECPVCHKMFRDDWALQTHTRSVHD